MRNDGWPRDDLDRFVLDRLEREGLRPSPEADRETWLRRESLDLTGLPPTPEETDAFLADTRAGARERQVDRLLASPRYGERMASQWLDLARYADTYGYQSDVYRAMWPWRDWVVDAFNRNLPYDRFLTWQIAGDLLPEPTREQIIATAFQRHHRQTNEGGSVEEEFRLEYVADRTNTFGTVFLGLTLECARCHDHKYDPISQEEYYGLSAFFSGIDESGLYSHFTDAVPTPSLLLPDEEQEGAIAKAEQRIAAAEARLDALRDPTRAGYLRWRAEVSEAPEADLRGVSDGLAGHYPLDAIDGKGRVADLAAPGDEARARRVEGAPRVVDGFEGSALEFDGENGVLLPGHRFTRDDPFSLSLRVRATRRTDRAVIIHRSRAWTDAGSRGWEVRIEDGQVAAALVHFWPGNAVGVRTREELPLERWVHLALTWDGSSRASGLRLYLDGEEATVDVVRDHLYRDITGGGVSGILLARRFRDRGFLGGAIDDVRVWGRRLSGLEVLALGRPERARSALSGEAPDGESPGEPDGGWRAPHDALLLEHWLLRHDPGHAEALAAATAARKARSEALRPVAEIMVLREMRTPRPVHVLARGAYDAPGRRVEPGTPAALPPRPALPPRDSRPRSWRRWRWSPRRCSATRRP